MFRYRTARTLPSVSESQQNTSIRRSLLSQHKVQTHFQAIQQVWRLVCVGLIGSLVLLLYYRLALPRSECVISFGPYKGHQYTTKETVGSPKCWLESKWMRVQQHQVNFEGQSSSIPDWLWIDYHDRINVLVEAPSTSGERQFYAFLQSKYALEGRMSKAIIGGIIEPGEKPDIAAQREVEEEMNLKCEEFHFLGRFRTDVNRGMGWVNSFLAAHCQPLVKGKNTDEPNAEAEVMENQVGASDVERQDLIKLTRTELQEAVRQGEFLEVQWSNTVALALLHPELASTT